MSVAVAGADADADGPRFLFYEALLHLDAPGERLHALLARLGARSDAAFGACATARQIAALIRVASPRENQAHSSASIRESGARVQSYEAESTDSSNVGASTASVPVAALFPLLRCLRLAVAQSDALEFARLLSLLCDDYFAQCMLKRCECFQVFVFSLVSIREEAVHLKCLRKTINQLI